MSKKTDVLFIHPGGQKKNYQSLSSEFTAISTPSWALLIAEYMRNNGYSVSIYDVNVNGWGEDEAKKIVSYYNPELIVIMAYGHNPSASTQTMPHVENIANDIKNYNNDLPIAVGGIHPTALPEYTLMHGNFDFVISGEGPVTIKGLINVLKGKRNIKSVPGLWYFEKSNIMFTNSATNIKDLDGLLSGYAWDLLGGVNHYRAHTMHCFDDFEKSTKDDFSDVRSPYVSIYTSLGCPFSCYYCSINAIFGEPSIRYWSVNTVIKWIDELFLKYNVRNIRFDDELFILSKDRVEQICDCLIERKYELNLWVYARVDTVSLKLLEKMKKAGINWICLGIESADNYVLNKVNKKNRGDIHKLLYEFKKSGINILGNFMFGLPEDNFSTMQKTLDLAIDLNCEYVNFYTTMAYPGSRLWEELAHDNLSNYNWNEFSQLGYETIPLSNNYLSSSQILEFRDKAFVTYFTNKKYTDMIGRKFGPKVYKHIQKMLSVKLKRYNADFLKK